MVDSRHQSSRLELWADETPSQLLGKPVNRISPLQ